MPPVAIVHSEETLAGLVLQDRVVRVLQERGLKEQEVRRGVILL